MTEGWVRLSIFCASVMKFFKVGLSCPFLCIWCEIVVIILKYCPSYHGKLTLDCIMSNELDYNYENFTDPFYGKVFDLLTLIVPFKKTWSCVYVSFTHVTLNIQSQLKTKNT